MAEIINSPTPEEIKAAREAASDTQSEAAARVHSPSYRAWQNWENGSRAMPPAAWELYLIKTGQFYHESPQPDIASEISIMTAEKQIQAILSKLEKTIDKSVTEIRLNLISKDLVKKKITIKISDEKFPAPWENDPKFQ